MTMDEATVLYEAQAYDIWVGARRLRSPGPLDPTRVWINWSSGAGISELVSASVAVAPTGSTWEWVGRP